MQKLIGTIKTILHKFGFKNAQLRYNGKIVRGIILIAIVYGAYNKVMKKRSQIPKSIIPPVPVPVLVPKPKIELEDIKKSELLEQIYNQTLRARDVPEEFKSFVSDQKEQDYLLEEYGMNNDKIKEKLKTYLKGMRRARGDGNCFYTSFGFQYLRHMFTKASDQQFEDFIKMIQSLPFSVIHSEQLYEKNEEMSQIFLNYCEYLRTTELEKREQEFIQLFSNSEGQFYGLCIIFLRNLTYKFCFEDEDAKSVFEVLEMNLQQQILTWEFDCENNQTVINILSRKLLIDIILYFIDEENKQLQVQEYKIGNPQILLEVHIIFRPGHYNVAIPNQ